MKQPLDAAPGQFLELLRNQKSTEAAALCREDVTFVDTGGQVRGDAARAVLPTLSIASSALIDKHHDVARLALKDGSLLFVRSDGSGIITELVRFPADGSSETPSAVKAYQDAWNVGAAGRATHLRNGWTATSRYQDPTAQGVGPNELSRVIDAFRAQFPGSSIVADGEMQRLPGRWIAFGWTLTSGTSELLGFDVGQVDELDRPLFISGFFSPR